MPLQQHPNINPPEIGQSGEDSFFGTTGKAAMYLSHERQHSSMVRPRNLQAVSGNRSTTVPNGEHLLCKSGILVLAVDHKTSGLGIWPRWLHWAQMIHQPLLPSSSLPGNTHPQARCR
ncbi:hypothetical protein Q8A73_022666 [Channa argus]|nr:hypothetical protein Q8A73_022666 [Channa argus]